MSAPISQLVPTPLQAVAMSDSAPLILHVFPTFAVGGAQLRFVAVANRLGRAWRHAVVALDGNTACGARLDPALDVSFPQVRLEKGNILGNMRRNRAFLRDLRPALLVTSNWGAMEWALANRWRQLPHIHTEDGFGPDEATRQLPRRVWARRLGLRRATVVVPSRRLWTIATQRWRLAPARVHYIPNGVDLTGFAVTHLARQNGDEPVIGAVAALRPEKNLARLLRAFHQVVRAGDVRGRLVVVGDGAERARLEALAAALGLTQLVRFAGYTADPRPFYAQFDLLALPSDTEQMPLSVLEAMAAGLPVVATDVGDVRGMLADANAALVCPAEDGAFAAALRTLLIDPALRLAVGQANRAKAASDYDQEAMFLRYDALWRGIYGG